jgi:hypothetical protein
MYCLQKRSFGIVMKTSISKLIRTEIIKDTLVEAPLESLGF